LKVSHKILIALQFWQGDRWQAEALGRFLADLELTHSDLADVLLVNRHDCQPVSRDVAQAISRKFNLFQYTAPRGNTGWPAGCNSLWINTVRWAQSMMEANRVPSYKAIFTCETDGAPVFRDWVARLSQAWDTANQPTPVCVAGPIVQIPSEHMNGNLMVNGNTEIFKWVIRLASNVPSTGGWDFLLSKDFKKRGWANIPGIVSYYNTRGYTVEKYAKLQSDNLIWVHGVKDNSLIELGRRFLINERL